ncbi:hypothetical protein G7Z17_g514 [Cylindrodendrum hubeiense]|uniref:Uncharacterized protein n=1 Tax=Cylindrodendrum hubeiense TaxID=595255 RepID=A0A9P5HJY7_9HYPO|nr:hypothetical protein G7Z17_g514 [Cylindrodendrum hubeiense]
MASLNYDYELMTNYIEAANVNGDGRRVLVDVGSALGVANTTKIQAFDVQQSQDLSVFLVFAAQIDQQTSTVWIVKPFKFGDEISWEAQQSKAVGQVHQIRVGPPPSRGSTFPPVYLMHQPLHRTASNSDLSRLQVTTSAGIIVHKDVSLPVNVQKIIDIAPAYGGVFGHGVIHAKYGRPGDEPGDPFKWAEYKLQCPIGATSIETFPDPRDKEKRSSLMVACPKGLYLLDAKNITGHVQGPGAMVGASDVLSGAQGLQISLEGKNMSIWVINGSGELTFTTLNLDLPQDARSAPLLPGQKSTAFATLLSRVNSEGDLQTLVISNDDHGNLMLLEQSVKTGVWRQQPFYVESDGVLKPIESYTFSITASQSPKMPLIQGEMLVTSTSPQSITANGRIVSIDSVGTWCSTDLSGELALIVPTQGTTGQPIIIVGMRTQQGEKLDFKPVQMDPSRKVIDEMKKLSSKEALENAKTKDGKSLWEGSEKPEGKTLEQAAKCFAAISDAHETLPRDGSKVEVVAQPSDQLQQTTGDWFLDAFYWLKRKIHDVKDWVVKKIGQVWTFVCEIGGKVMRFVLDCIEKVTEAASWVWEKLKLGWNKLVEFVGFFFSWQDILETKETIKGLMNAGLDYVADGVEGFNSEIEGFFLDLQSSIPGLTDKAKAKIESSRLNQATKADEKKAKDVGSNTQSKWVGERMKNGGSMTAASGSTELGDAAAIDMWNDRVVPLVDSFIALAEDLGKDLAELFQDSDMSIGDMFSKLGSNLLVNTLDIIKKLIQALVSVVAKLVVAIKSFGNAQLSSGFLNTLYRWITRGSDLTLFDAIALLIAIPSTQIIKIVTGAKPPSLGLIDKNLFETMISSEDKPSSEITVASKQQKKDVTTILLGCGCGAACIKLVVNDIKFLYKTVTQGLSVAVGDLSPGAIMELFGMGVDAFAIFEAIMDPPTADTPGAELIKAATYIKMFRFGANALYMMAQKLGKEDPALDQVMLVLDLLTALANFGLYNVIYIMELDDPNREGYDEDQILANGADNFLEALSAIGYFTAFTFNKSEPVTTTVGLACMKYAAIGAIMTKGVNFKIEYKKEA